MIDKKEIEEYSGEDDMPYDEYVSECCGAYPIGELDISTVQYGGPSGFCGRCKDNSIFERP